MPAEGRPDSPGVRIGRLKQRRDFLRVAGGRKSARPGLVLQAREAPSEGPGQDPAPEVRIGFTATRKIGTAVARNRARRRLRAAASAVLTRAGRPGHDYVLVARAGTLTRRFAELLGDLEAALEEVHRKRTGRERRGAGPSSPAGAPDPGPDVGVQTEL